MVFLTPFPHSFLFHIRLVRLFVSSRLRHDLLYQTQSPHQQIILLATIHLIVEGNLVYLGNRLMVTSIQAFQEGQLVAEGKAVYNFIKSKS